MKGQSGDRRRVMRRGTMGLVGGVVLVLAGCGTPQERCIARETRDLRVLDRLIAETSATIARGYALESESFVVTQTFPCQVRGPDNRVRTELCDRDEVVERTRPVAVNLDDERAKLRSMEARRAELARSVAGRVEACRAAYPE
jgi:hypothetical protein